MSAGKAARHTPPIEADALPPYVGGMTEISLSRNAANRVRAIAEKQGKPGLKLRLAVDGGGCAGFQYRFGLEEQAGDDDLAVTTDGVTLLVDSISLPFLDGCEVDFVESLAGKSFQVKNPNATSGCGCGTSFSV